MRDSMELNGGLHRRHDSEPKWRKLHRQFLDAESKSGDQQRRRGQWPALDCHWSMLELLICAGNSDWVGRFWDDQLQHKPQLECGHPAGGMQCQLQGTAERSLDCVPNHNIRCRDRSHAFDYL
jgi:hypothetical protein